MPTLTMSHRAFRELVLPVMPMIAESSAVQALEAVRIYTEPGRVVAEAVSATMLGMCVRPLEDAPAGFDLLFPAADIPVAPSMFDEIGLEQTTHGTVIVDWSVAGSSPALREFNVLPGRLFPDLRKKLVQALEVTEHAKFANLTAAQLVAFSVCAERTNNPHEAPLVIHPGATVHDMVLITCGDHFAGLATASSTIRHQPTRTKLRMPNPPAGDPIELWKTQLSTPEGE